MSREIWRQQDAKAAEEEAAKRADGKPPVIVPQPGPSTAPGGKAPKGRAAAYYKEPQSAVPSYGKPSAAATINSTTDKVLYDEEEEDTFSVEVDMSSPQRDQQRPTNRGPQTQEQIQVSLAEKKKKSSTSSGFYTKAYGSSHHHNNSSGSNLKFQE